MDDNMIDVLSFGFSLQDYTFKASINWPVVLLFVCVVCLWAWFSVRKGKYHAVKKTVTLSLGAHTSSYVLERDYTLVEVAHKIYIELITRKAALPFDDDCDIILEVYDSWYQLFGVIRNEVKSLSGRMIVEKSSTKDLISMSSDILNKGLRPHLTKYQGKFRKWCGDTILNDPKFDKTPQEMQRMYPEYDELVSDLKQVNSLLVEYAEQLRGFIYGNGS